MLWREIKERSWGVMGCGQKNMPGFSGKVSLKGGEI